MLVPMYVASPSRKRSTVIVALLLLLLIPTLDAYTGPIDSIDTGLVNRVHFRLIL